MIIAPPPIEQGEGKEREKKRNQKKSPKKKRTIQ